MICTKCKNTVPDTSKFCPKCGTKVEIAKAQQSEQKLAERPAEKQGDVILCPKCGTSYPLTAKFCKKDGTPLQKVAPISKEEVKQPEVKEKEAKQEAVVEPITRAVTAETRVEEKLPEKAPEIDKPKDTIICPKCGTPNPLTAKFCKKDGTPLKEEVRPLESKEKEVKPEVIIETKPPEIIAEKEVEKPTEKVLEIEEQKVKPPVKEEVKPLTKAEKEIKSEKVVQPQIKEAAPPITAVKKEPAGRPSKTWVWLTIIGVIIIIAGVGSYFYFSGQPSKKTSEVAIAPEVSKPPEPTKPPEEVVKPSDVTPPPEVRPEVEKPMRPPEPRKEIVPPPMPQAGPAKPPIDIIKLEREVNTSLRNKGLNDIYAEVDTGLTATLMGTAGSREERDRALGITRSHKEIKEVRDNIRVREVVPPPTPAPPPKVDPAKLEGDINRALRNAGLKGINAEVSDDLQVTLKGSVGSAQEKNRAFEIAKTFKNVKRIRDVIFVVE